MFMNFRSSLVTFDCFYRQELCIELFSNDALDQLLVYPTSMQPHSGYNNFVKVDSGFTIKFSNLQLWERVKLEPIALTGWVRLIDRPCGSSHTAIVHNSLEKWSLGWLAHLVSRFACNARVIVNTCSNPSVSYVKLM